MEGGSDVGGGDSSVSMSACTVDESAPSCVLFSVGVQYFLEGTWDGEVSWNESSRVLWCCRLLPLSVTSGGLSLVRMLRGSLVDLFMSFSCAELDEEFVGVDMFDFFGVTGCLATASELGVVFALREDDDEDVVGMMMPVLDRSA